MDGKRRRSHFRGENPADLPVQAPTLYELAIYLRSAKALGIDIPPALLAIAELIWRSRARELYGGRIHGASL